MALHNDVNAFTKRNAMQNVTTDIVIHIIQLFETLLISYRPTSENTAR